MSATVTARHTRSDILDIRQRLVVFVVGFLIALFMEGFDSFGLATMKDRHSASLASVVEQMMPSNYNEAAHEAVTVFLIDKDTKDKAGFDTPYMPYGTLATYLKTIIKAKPKAIFIDFNLSIHTSDVPGRNKLIQALKDAKAQNIPVYTGAIADHPNMHGIKTRVTEVSLTWPKSLELDYPFLGARDLNSGDDLNVVTAAPMIYRDLCGGDLDIQYRFDCSMAGKINGLLKDSQGKSAEARSDASEIAPLFQTYVPYRLPMRPKLPRSEAECVPAKAWRQLELLVARSLLKSVDEKANSPAKCVAVPYYSLGRIYMPTPGRVRPNAAMLDTRVTGKIVMIGDGLGKDRYDAPVFGYLDGVFHHALVLQDLLASGETYTRWPEKKIDLAGLGVEFSVGGGFLVEWLISFVVVVATLVIWHHRVFMANAGRERLFLGLATAFVLPVVLAVFASYAEVRWLHWPTVNILNIFGIVGGLLAVMELDRLVVQRRRWLAVAAGIAIVVVVVGCWRLMSVLA